VAIITPAMINEYAILKTIKGRLEKREKELKNILEPAADIAKPFRTRGWCLTYTVTPMTTLSTARIREDKGDAWCKDYEVSGERKELKPTCLTEAGALIKQAEIDATVAAQLLSVLIDQAQESVASKVLGSLSKR
jgi:hypothetical protein